MTPPKKSGATRHVEGHANSVVGLSLRHLLRQSGINVAPEVKGMGGAKPDIYIEAGAYRIVIEAKYGNRKAAADAARARFAGMNPPPHIVGALSYSPPFQTNPEKAAREGALVEFAFAGHDPDEDAPQLDPAKWRPVWHSGTVYDLAQALRRPRAIVAPQADEIEGAVGEINGALAQFQSHFNDKPALTMRVAKILQVNLADSKGEEREALESEALRVAGLILIGALMFHFALAEKEKRVDPPMQILRRAFALDKLFAHWQFILDNINYAAIFRVALQIADTSQMDLNLVRTLADTARNAREITQGGADLTGQIYHRVLADAKTLAAFYTSIPAAMMMSKIALDMDSRGGAKKWADLDFLRELKVADPACGSGTLLTAAAWQIRDNFLRADFRENGAIESEKARGRITELHRAMLEEIMWGYDILETAAHLTAANLGMMSPGVDFRKAHIYRIIIGKTGKKGVAAGSLEMLDGMPMFNRGDQQLETGEESEPLPELDLCIMNPPFVRGTAGNESFNFLPSGEQESVQARMRELGKQFGFVCDKGQGPGFVALACKQMKPGGRIAMILPATLAAGMGKAWGGSREKLERDFDLETLIVSRDSEHPNFSVSTNLQECICIVRKRRNGDKPEKKALFVALHRNPQSGGDGLAAARAILKAEKEGRDLGDLDEGFGQFARLAWHGKSAWRGVSFANLHLAFVAERFAVDGSLSPLVSKGRAPLRPLSELADLGSHRLDLYLNDREEKNRRARLSPTETEYAGYYPGFHKRNTGTGHKDTAAILEEPHCWLLPLEDAERGERNERWAESFFAKSGRIVINQSFGFQTARRLASLISRPVQASHYWPVQLRKESELRRKALTVWLNSSPSVLLIAHSCSSTKGAKVNFSQVAAKELPVADLDALTSAQIRRLAKGFDDVVKATARGEGLLPMPLMTEDPTRKMLDDAVSEALGMGDLHPLRAALAQEPIIVSRPPAGD